MDAPVEWEEAHRPLIGRLAGVLLLIGLAATFVDPANTSSKVFTNLSTQQIVDWAAHNATGISVTGLVEGLQNSLVGVAVVTLTWLIRGRGVLVAVAYVSIAAFMAIGWVKAGVVWALADTAVQGGSDAGAVALFRLVHAMTFTDGFSFAIAVSCVSALMLLTRLFPAPIAWLGFATALVHFLSLPTQLLLTGSAGGITGPITVVFALAWLLATALTLLIKPVWEPRLKLAAASVDR
ncbi:MAG TPA: hypothetical protein VHJ99_11745 [Candidatus Dormibacteraeota bacterium]|nr:hypothetical protein [Candidatus Dormibacteraeota bacterium]